MPSLQTLGLRSIYRQTRPRSTYVLYRRFTTTRSNFQVMDINTKYKMPSGYEIPALGFGTGYRHIDSALAYQNEKPCAAAMRASGIKREDLFFTSKVPPRAMGYEATKKAIETSFEESGLDYIDLYLIHCPLGGREARAGSWRALVEAQKAGKIRSLGVSNYGVHHLEELESQIKDLESKSPGSGGVISVGQWEVHPWCGRADIVKWCKDRGIVVEAFSPIVRNQRSEEPALVELGKKYGVTPNQVLLRWSLQMGFIPLPKSENKDRIEQNATVYGWKLSDEDMDKLKTGKYEPCAWDPSVSGLDN